MPERLLILTSNIHDTFLSNMHLCLQITEVLSAVLQAIDADSKLPTNAAMARTCRAFYEPASDALWEDLPRLGPLLKCLPEQTIRTLEYPSVGMHPMFACYSGR